ncbi:MAG: hypothetical protein ACXQS5_04205 [Candidatus Methanospirareceae archaeon]
MRGGVAERWARCIENGIENFAGGRRGAFLPVPKGEASSPQGRWLQTLIDASLAGGSCDVRGTSQGRMGNCVRRHLWAS